MVLPVVLAGALCILIVRQRTPFTPGFALLYGVLLVLLAWSEAAGLAFVPALAAGFAYSALVRWRSIGAEGRQIAGVHLAVVAAILLLIPLYFLGLEKVNENYDLGIRLSLKTSVAVLTQGFGPVLRGPLWPYSGLATVGLFLVSVLALLHLAWTSPTERFRAVELLCFLGGAASLFLAIGKARANELQSDPTTLSHLTILALPPLCGIYLTWSIRGGPAGALVQTSLFALTCILLWPSVEGGLSSGRMSRSHLRVMRLDLEAGMPLAVLAERQLAQEGPFSDSDFGKAYLTSHYAMLRRAGVGPFRRLKDVPVREVAVAPEPAALSQMTWADSIGRGTGTNSTATFTLAEPAFVYAIRLNYTYPEAASDTLKVLYRNGREEDFSKAVPSPTLELQPGKQASATFWVNATVTEFAVQPDVKPNAFQLSGITLFVPPSGRH